MAPTSSHPLATGRRRLALGALALAAVAGVVLLVLPAPTPPAPADKPAVAPAAAGGRVVPVQASAATVAAAPVTASGASALLPSTSATAVPADAAAVPRPPGVDAAAWSRVVKAVGGDRAELTRIGEHLTWADAARRFRAAAAGSSQRRELAAQLDAGLDARLARRELQAAEALAWKRALLAETLADAGEQQRRLDAWVESRPAGAFGDAAAQPDPRQARFERLQAELLTRHGHAGDPRALEAELEALRARVFGASAPSD